MTLLAIPNAISAAVSQLSHHGHKKGVHGSANPATDSTSAGDDQSGSTQSLFGSLLDTAEQVVGIQTPTTTAPAAGVNATLTSPNVSKTSTAQMISAARAALHKVV